MFYPTRTFPATFRPWRLLATVAALLVIQATSATESSAITPDNPGSADVRLTINSLATPSRAISPYIYGMNFFAGSSLTNPVTVDRLGGNRWSGYNWETNASNAGSDWFHQSDTFLVGGANNTPPGQAVLPSLQSAATNDRALIVTVPIAGYASADTSGPVTEAQAAPSSRWREVIAKKSTNYPGAPLALAPNKTDGYVFTDEFVNWVEQTKQPGQEVFYSLDNEPGLWNHTHQRLHPGQPTFAEMRDKTIAHASAIKDVNPNAKVFGGVGYGWQDFVQLQDATDKVTSPSHPGGDQSGELHFYEWLLKETAAAEAAQGRKLMDVLDLHWYPEATGGGVRITENDNSAAVVAARVQAPRSLWDPTYTETSWISQWGTWTGSPGNPGPVRLLPRVQRDVNDFNPGTKIAITEYNYGGTNHISGGIAQADALGVFGKQDVFAATFWSLYGDSQSQFVSGAFKMYLDYDGAGGRFGDESIAAATTSLDQSAVYASLDSQDPNQMILVAINRTAAAKSTALEVTHDRRFDLAEVYQLTSASATPQRVADIPIELVNAFLYTMPAYSVSTIVLRSGADGDFNLDGAVDGDDLAVWETGFGMASGASFRDGDNDRDGDVDGADFLAWHRGVQAGAGATPSSAVVPEPASWVATIIGLAAGVRAFGRKRAV
ncbi:MAG: hypothetical protein JNL18_03345 [Planctomycetaceae bacterium]|nr:hypothetical protein [Planctomycetaceae bacterium]